MSQTRAIIMKALHGYAKNSFGLDNPHPLLHQLAVTHFDVESMSDLSTDNLQDMKALLEEHKVDWNKIEELGLTRIPEMGEPQQALVKRCQRELGWSNDYLQEVAMKRYGFVDWIYLTGREAWAFCNYLIQRSRQKRGKAGYKAKGKRRLKVYLIRVKTFAIPCWFCAAQTGDPGRTLIKSEATKYNDRSRCQKQVDELEHHYPHRSFSIEEVDE